MGRSILAVVVAWVLWTAMWLGGSAAAAAVFPRAVTVGQPLFHTGALMGFIAWSVVASVAAGYVCAFVKKEAPMPTVWGLAALQFVIGTAIEVSGWDNTPAWYHLLFLALLIPAIVWGGKLRTGSLTNPA
ncbi:MAG: hypothetical protein OEO23_16355 [Gemmatimonadota bacterium]|nr:hypothetical protein [Gemmatimonadota bacterium]